MDPDRDILQINVSGRKFEVSKLTLAAYSRTLLGHLNDKSPYYLRKRNEYYFERHATSFEAILYYYQTGELHVPPSVCMGVFQSELKFWGVSAENLRTCCKGPFGGYIRNQRSLVQLEKHMEDKEKDGRQARPGTWAYIRAKVWKFLDSPTSSIGAQVYFWFLMVMASIAVCLTIIHSDANFQISLTESEYPHWMKEYLRKTNQKEIDEYGNITILDDSEIPVNRRIYWILEWVTASYFIIEIIVRFIFCPTKLKFFGTGRHVVDILSLSPYMLWGILEAALTVDDGGYSVGMKVVEGLGCLRFLRLFHLIHCVTGLRVMVYTFRASIKELILMWIMIFMFAGMFACVIFYVDTTDEFPSIQIGYWWALITMTSVGYGDTVPHHFWGQVVGIGCAIFGVIVVAITIPILTNNFMLYYNHMEGTPFVREGRDGFFKRQFVSLMAKRSSYSPAPTTNCNANHSRHR